MEQKKRTSGGRTNEFRINEWESLANGDDDDDNIIFMSK